MPVARRQSDARRRNPWLWCCATVLLVAGAGCGSPQSVRLPVPETPRVWPEPPEQARITYLGAISTEADLQKSSSLFQGLGDLLFGERQLGVLVSPYAVAVDTKGTLFVADSGGAVVHAFDLRTRDYRQFFSLSNGRRLQKPVGVAVLADRVYVVDSLLRCVCVFSADGKFQFEFGSDRFERPSGIACSPAGNVVYVTDTAAHTVYAFASNGAPLGRIGSRGTEAGQFNYPTQLWLDRAGQLYVSDTLNYRVQVFDSVGRVIRTFGQQGDRPGNFAHPCGIATDSRGNIYVADRQFENVQVFAPNGQILMAFGQEGQGPGEFWLPAGVCVDARDRIYVADSFNKRVQIFEPLGETGE
ncbi:MAG: 6-bladed beta-propeller [Sedimentisphaerales bacterium]|nr:6-bladed beta-propeller [Sedimentisphaerales bacterium]